MLFLTNKFMSTNFSPDKPFKTYSQQIELLKNRNLTINDAEFAEHFLKVYSYYDLINGNVDSLLISHHPDKFKDNVTFENLVQIKFIEERLKSLFLSQILDIEKSFKTILAYHISENFGVNSGVGGYLTKRNYSPSQSKQVKTTMKKLRDIRDGTAMTSKHESKSIIYYRENHNHIPPWILVNELTFGELFFWYKCLPQDIKININSELVSQSADGIDTELFIPMLDLLREFRNFFAHNSVLSQMKSERQLDKSQLKKITLKNTNSIKPADIISQNNDINCCLIAILCLSNDYDQIDYFYRQLYALVNIIDEEPLSGNKNFFSDIFNLSTRTLQLLKAYIK